MHEHARPAALVPFAVAISVGCWATLLHAGDLTPVSQDGVWETVDAVPQAVAGLEPWIRPDVFRLFRLNGDELADTLSRAPQESAAEARHTDVTMTLPMPDGTFARFRITESPIMAPELAAKFPQIKTYYGQGLDDPAATVRFDWTPKGFHAQVLSPNGAVYIDPYWKNDSSVHVSYYKHDYRNPAEPFSCLVHSHAADTRQAAAASGPLRSGETLRTYRLACACTGEYTQFHGGTKAAGMAAIVTAINRVTGIYEAEVAVRLELVPDNDKLVYTNPSTDPYTNGSGSAMLGQNQGTIDNVIGKANYDIGHVFSTGGGGVAYLGVICVTNWKAGGVTGRYSPIGDPFYVDYVAHEMGHQFGGNHSFNGVKGSCGGYNRYGPSAYEPGSGSTIMAYAGICGADNLQPHSDPYFHSISFDEIRNYITGYGDTCAAVTSTGNDAPTVYAGPDYTIPRGTPFVLTASGSDPNGDVLTYCWEQRDRGPAAALSAPDDGSIPLFRSFNPTTDPSRTFPRLSDLLYDTPSDAEKLPSANRIMDFRVQARDNRAGGGGVDWDQMRVSVEAASGPFVVTFPNTAIVSNGPQLVTWAVAGTDSPPVSVSHVDILLSTDFGHTFPTVLASSTANDGTETVTIPDVDTSLGRIKVEPVGNVFFAISVSCPPTAAPDPESIPLNKIRYLSIVPGNAGRDTALRVTFTDLPAPFGDFEGQSMWVGRPEEICENAGHDVPPEGGCGPAPGLAALSFWAATLQCDPYYTDWGTYDAVHVYHQGIVPKGVYQIQAIDEVCDPGIDGNYSSALALDTSIWGDLVRDCTTDPCGAPDGVVGIPTDVTAALDKFKNLGPPGIPNAAVIKARADVEPDVPDQLVNISDVTEILDAFRGFDYPFAGPTGCP